MRNFAEDLNLNQSKVLAVLPTLVELDLVGKRERCETEGYQGSDATHTYNSKSENCVGFAAVSGRKIAAGFLASSKSPHIH